MKDKETLLGVIIYLCCLAGLVVLIVLMAKGEILQKWKIKLLTC